MQFLRFCRRPKYLRDLSRTENQNSVIKMTTLSVYSVSYKRTNCIVVFFLLLLFTITFGFHAVFRRAVFYEKGEKLERFVGAMIIV